MKILKTEMRICRKGPEAWFSGVVWLDEIVTGEAPSRMKAFRVSFEPGARTAWHTHPLGQALHVLSGVGVVQLKGSPPQEMRAGDTVWIGAGEVHWHGASAPTRWSIWRCRRPMRMGRMWFGWSTFEGGIGNPVLCVDLQRMGFQDKEVGAGP